MPSPWSKWAGSPQVPILQYFQIEIRPNLSKITLLPKMGMSKKSRQFKFWGKNKKRLEAQRQRQPEAFQKIPFLKTLDLEI